MNWLKRIGVLLASTILVVGPGCATLGKRITLTDPETGETTETTVGDVAADTVEGVGDTLSSVISTVATAATGNPIVGAGAGAAILTLLGAGASRLRRKKEG